MNNIKFFSYFFLIFFALSGSSNQKHVDEFLEKINALSKEQRLLYFCALHFFKIEHSFFLSGGARDKNFLFDFQNIKKDNKNMPNVGKDIAFLADGINRLIQSENFESNKITTILSDQFDNYFNQIMKKIRLIAFWIKQYLPRQVINKNINDMSLADSMKIKTEDNFKIQSGDVISQILYPFNQDTVKKEYFQKILLQDYALLHSMNKILEATSSLISTDYYNNKNAMKPKL